MQCLVVDDEADARDFITMLLAQCGAQVKAVGSVLEALSAGFQQHVTKPVEPAELAAVVANLWQGARG